MKRMGARQSVGPLIIDQKKRHNSKINHIPKHITLTDRKHYLSEKVIGGYVYSFPINKLV